MVTYGVVGHEMSGTGDWALFSQASDLAGVVNLVVLKDAEFLLLPLVLILLGGGVLLLLALFTTTSKSEHEMEDGLLFTGSNLIISKIIQTSAI